MRGEPPPDSLGQLDLAGTKHDVSNLGKSRSHLQTEPSGLFAWLTLPLLLEERTLQKHPLAHANGWIFQAIQNSDFCRYRTHPLHLWRV